MTPEVFLDLNRDEILEIWKDRDDFIVSLGAFSTFGPTVEEALRNLTELMEGS